MLSQIPKQKTKREAMALPRLIEGCERGSFGLGAEGGGRGSSFFSTCTGFLHQGAPTPVTKLPIPRHLGSASSKLSNWGPIRRSAPPPDSSLLACLRGQRRQGFHTSHSFLSGGGGDAGAKDGAEAGRREGKQRRWRQKGRDKDEKADRNSQTVFPPVGVRTAGQLSRRGVDVSSLP